jgi:nucleotide-binding universal stress UspA family protein
MTTQSFATVPTIVVGVDAAPSARAALRWAAGEALLRGARLAIVHAYDAVPLPVVPGALSLPQSVFDAAQEAAQDVVQEAADDVPRAWSSRPRPSRVRPVRSSRAVRREPSCSSSAAAPTTPPWSAWRWAASPSTA